MKVKEIEGDTQGNPSRITRLMESKFCILKGLYGGLVGGRYVSTAWLGAWSVLWPGSRRGVTMWVSMSLLSIVSARTLSSGVIQPSSTDCVEWSCTGCYSGRVPAAPYRFRRKVRRRDTSLTNHDHLSMDAFCVPLVQHSRSEAWHTCCHYTKSSCWVLPCTLGLCCSMCCAQLCSLPCAAQPSMMHVEGNTTLKIAFRLGRPVAVPRSTWQAL